jgi:hypothetical protein
METEMRAETFANLQEYSAAETCNAELSYITI